MTADGAGATRAGPDPAAEHAGSRRGIPARVRVMGWMILLMAVVLLCVTVVSHTLLLRQAENLVNTALEQEANEFSNVAASGVDRATGEPFADVRELLHNHLQRQYPDDDEVLVAAVREGEGWYVLRQDRDGPLALHEHRDILDPILESPDGAGSADTPAGEMRWSKVVANNEDAADQEGVFVVGYLIDRERAEVDRTTRTLALVSGFGLALSAAASWLIAGRILAPVRLVNSAAAQITGRDFTRRIPVEGTDEFATLAVQFNAMLDRLERAFAAEREFVDDAGHELRTPITIIRGHLELLEALPDDPDERAAAMRVCTDELDRMSRIVDDLLLLAKSEQPDFVSVEPVEFAELTSDIHAKIRALGDRRWRIDSIGEGVVVLDPQRITQAMVQLAQNAVQHTDQGQDIRFGSVHEHGRTALWITDHGQGVPPDDADKIFDRFARGESGGSGQRSGAGLGLSIVRAIAEAHSGTVELDSTPGAGATFRIELPAPGGDTA